MNETDRSDTARHGLRGCGRAVRRTFPRLLGLALLWGTAAADPARFTDTARVVAVEPLLERIYEPVRNRECREIPPPLLPPASTPGEDIRRQLALVGGGREQRCHWVESRAPVERVRGYLVTYEYGGRRYVRHADRPPGERMAVHVALEPLP